MRHAVARNGERQAVALLRLPEQRGHGRIARRLARPVVPRMIEEPAIETGENLLALGWRLPARKHTAVHGVNHEPERLRRERRIGILTDKGFRAIEAACVADRAEHAAGGFT